MDSTKPEIIYLIARWKGNKLVYPSGFSVLPKNWNVKAGEVRNVISEMHREAINHTLKDLRAAVSACYTENITRHTPLTPEVLREYLNTYTGRTLQPDRSFWPFVEALILAAPTKLTANGKPISPRQVQRYKTTVSILRELEKEHRLKLDFDVIGRPDFFNVWYDFLTYKKRFAVNTVAGYTVVLKTFLSAAMSSGVTDLQPEKIRKTFNVREEETTAVYLTAGELVRLRALDLSHSARLEKARDLFLIGCYTGLRISDFKTLKAHNIKAETLEVFQKKTGGKVHIPISPVLRLLLEKYANGLPALSDQKLNEYIKEVAKLAGVEEQIEMRRTVAGKLQKTLSPKWELITSHTARRSFATNAYKDGIPARSIMAITGHKSESAFQKYIRLNGEEHAAIMAQQWQETPTATTPTQTKKTR